MFYIMRGIPFYYSSTGSFWYGLFLKFAFLTGVITFRNISRLIEVRLYMVPEAILLIAMSSMSYFEVLYTHTACIDEFRRNLRSSLLYDS